MTRSISINEDTYELLDKYRLKNETFSETIKRLLESNLDIMKLAGAWKKIPDVEPALAMIEKNIKKIHDAETNDIKMI